MNLTKALKISAVLCLLLPMLTQAQGQTPKLPNLEFTYSSYQPNGGTPGIYQFNKTSLVIENLSQLRMKPIQAKAFRGNRQWNRLRMIHRGRKTIVRLPEGIWKTGEQVTIKITARLVR